MTTQPHGDASCNEKHFISKWEIANKEWLLGKWLYFPLLLRATDKNEMAFIVLSQ